MAGFAFGALKSGVKALADSKKDAAKQDSGDASDGLAKVAKTIKKRIGKPE